MTERSWHLPDEALRRYAARELTPPWLWSVEAHLAACPACRTKLTETVGPELIHAGWTRLDTELDAPVPGPAEALLIRVGVTDHTARLLAATPALRLSWLIAVAVTLAITAAIVGLAQTVSAPLVFLGLAPLLPLVGVAASFGPRVDPTYEIALVAPMRTFRLLLVRCVAVLATTTTLSAATSLALPEYGLRALGWFLPALALTGLSLGLTPRLGPVTAALAVGLGWVALLASTVRVDTGYSPLFGTAGQLALAAVTALAAVLVGKVRPSFDTPRQLNRAPRFGLRRLP